MTNRSTFERIALIAVPLLLIAGLAVAGVWGSEATAKAEALERSVADMYRGSFYELTNNVNDMQVALKKLLVVSSQQQHILLLSDVWRLSGAASANLSALPQPHTDTAELNRFIVQTGDYAHALTRRLLNGEVLSSDDREQLYALYESSVAVARELEERLDSDDLPVRVLGTDGYYGTDTQAGAQQTAGAAAGEAGGEAEASIANYPTLIYDGPFSESTEKAEPRGLPAYEVSDQDALIAALEYLGQGAQLAFAGESGGTIAAYGFAGTDPDGRSVEIAVSKRGGKLLWMMCQTNGAEEGVPDAETTARMRDAAKTYLDAHGYDDMEVTYAQFYAGVAVYNFASTQDGVLLYSDLVKVYVERATDKIVGVDANNYLFSHTTRTLPESLISQETARHSVSDALEVASVQLAYIPLTAATETLCYEFKGTCRGAEFIVYVNAVTGAEEQVFEILNADEGQLVV